jgi:hypothetical protein
LALDQVRRITSESLRRRPRGAGRHRFLDDILQFSAPAPGDEQSDADGCVARWHGQNRGGGECCGYVASLGQRKRVAQVPTEEAEAAGSGLIFDKGWRNYALTPATRGPAIGVQFKGQLLSVLLENNSQVSVGLMN